MTKIIDKIYLKENLISIILFILLFSQMIIFSISFLQSQFPSENQYLDTYFNSDRILVMMVAIDIIDNGGSYFDWSLAGPMIIMITIFSIYYWFMGSSVLTIMLFLITQITLYMYLAVRLLVINYNLKHAIFIVAIFLTFFINNFEYPYLQLFIVDGNIMSVIITLFVLVKLLNTKYLETRYFVFLPIIIFLTIENVLLLPQLIIPFIITQIVIDKQFIKRYYFIYLLIIIFSLIGVFIKNKFLPRAHVSDVVFTFNTFYVGLYHIKEFFLNHSNLLQNLMVIPPLLFIPIIIIQNSPKTKKIVIHDALIVFYFFSFVFTMISFCITAPNINFRYMQILYFIGPFIFLIKFKTYFYYKINSILLLMVLVIINIFTANNFLTIGKKFHYSIYPEYIQELDRVFEEYNLQVGYCDYWTHLTIPYFSNKNIKMISIHDNKRSKHNTNRKWFQARADFSININPIVFGEKYRKKINIGENNIYIIK
jgi:hypothetical protein